MGEKNTRQPEGGQVAAGTQHLPLGTRQKFWQLEKRGHDFDSAEYKTVFRRSFFPRFFHIQTRSDLTSSTWKRLTFKTHTHLHVRRGVR